MRGGGDNFLDVTRILSSESFARGFPRTAVCKVKIKRTRQTKE